MTESLSRCPVPLEQQPKNEYQQLQESGLFAWATLDLTKYVRKLVWVWVWGWLISAPIAAASFDPQTSPLPFILWGTMGASVLVVFTVLRLYLGWSYVRDRLCASTVVYEESGWYDGQRWQKPPEMLMRDRLIVAYQVQPILLRLQRSLLILAIGLGIGTLLAVLL